MGFTPTTVCIDSMAWLPWHLDETKRWEYPQGFLVARHPPQCSLRIKLMTRTVACCVPFPAIPLPAKTFPMNGLAKRTCVGIFLLPSVHSGSKRLILLLFSKRYKLPFIPPGKVPEHVCMDEVGATQAFVFPKGESAKATIHLRTDHKLSTSAHTTS